VTFDRRVATHNPRAAGATASDIAVSIDCNLAGVRRLAAKLRRVTGLLVRARVNPGHDVMWPRPWFYDPRETGRRHREPRVTRPLEHSYSSAIPGSVLETSEVRWFAHGPLPAALLTWFTAGGRLGVEERRTDVYQRRSGTTVGVKRRWGRTLEVKVLERTGPEIALAGGLRGTCEEWRKWRPGNGATFSSGAVPWLSVQKSIVTRSFLLPGDGRAEPVGEPDRRLPGCDVELAAVNVRGLRAWTYAFEAFGPAEHRLAALRMAAEAVVCTTPYPPAFRECFDHNAGYPAWLDTLENSQAATAI
jgi:hypothetical protein